ncbi:hypothetical protein [Pseudomonas sp. 6D_7.1_Bac1]|uniref:hypothetical protein n=1 Tax=Pseudomonas sp. 6D_7.1_Bac1 TaxID=2971615 RepID=UPI0021C88B24|nr:hypothetical protein [Pseudomonas sp. 6D_7.1_Bac1]MCU1750071.1 hypothetical protein [Pseudomonas sp. 6D_7.1_Bac1]
MNLDCPQTANDVSEPIIEMTDTQQTALIGLIAVEQRHASRWWTFLNEMRRRNELPDWVKRQAVGGHADYDLWSESRTTLNNALFGACDPARRGSFQQVVL